MDIRPSSPKNRPAGQSSAQPGFRQQPVNSSDMKTRPQPKTPQPDGSKSSMHPGRKKKLLISGAIALVVVLLVGVLGAQAAFQGKEVYDHATAGRVKLEEAKVALEAQDLDGARVLLAEGRKEFEMAESGLDAFAWTASIGPLARQMNAARVLLVSVEQLTDTLNDVIDISESILEPIGTDSQIEFSALTPEQKGEALVALGNSKEALQGVEADLVEIQGNLEDIPEEGVVQQLVDARNTALDILPQVVQGLDYVVKFSEILPELAGANGTRNYLLLFQNNTELRPGGGFIGTYGVLTVENGDIVEFVSDDIYNLDKNSGIDVTPPVPLQQYLSSTQWFMRDANWSPDFPTSAEKVYEFYELEGGQGDFAGVIAITPSVLQRFLEVTGPLTVPGYPYEFTSDDATETLEFAVERDYKRLGISETDRKDLVGHFSNVLLDSVFGLQQDRWLPFVEIVLDEFAQRHAMMYSFNDDVQEVLVDRDWDGGQIETEADYVQFVDANMASLKSDDAVKRTLRYEVDASDLDNIMARISFRYDHERDFDWKTTRYRTYARAYVPAGSEFVSISGQDSADSENVTVEDDLGKTSFGFFKSIEPLTTEEVVLEYRLPDRIAEQIRAGTYHLHAQKQLGTDEHNLEVVLRFDRPITATSNPDLVSDQSDRSVMFMSDLTYDREFEVSLGN